jgi:hypothetical protein
MVNPRRLIDELVGPGVPAPELERLRRVDALLRLLADPQRSRETSCNPYVREPTKR